MEKYYKILGLDKSATDEEIKASYSELIRKYDPSNYDKEYLKKHAEEKTKEIIEAFDTIMNSKRSEQIQNENSQKNKKNTKEDIFEEIENLIEANMLEQAEEKLMKIPEEKRNTARWYYLKGVVLYKKGWLADASNFFAVAVKLNPSNEEYRKALEKATWQQNGRFNSPQTGPFSGPYPSGGPMGCSFCDICGTIMCADMCCDCASPRGAYRCC